MAAELFLGLPLFPGASEHDLLVRIVDMLGMPPDHVLQKAQHTNRYLPSPPMPHSCFLNITAGGQELLRRFAVLSADLQSGCCLALCLLSATTHDNLAKETCLSWCKLAVVGPVWLDRAQRKP